jgi:16S rRNA processing protein RimM
LSDYVVIGKVLGKRAKKEELKVKPFTDNPDRFRLLQKVYFHVSVDKVQSVDVEKVRKQGNLYLLTLTSSSEEDDTIISQGTLLKVPVEDVPPLDSDSYYYFQIEGLSVQTTGGHFLGIVDEIIQTGSNDVFVVKGEKEYLIPFISDVVVDIDLNKGTITIFPMAGLLDEV